MNTLSNKSMLHVKSRDFVVCVIKMKCSALCASYIIMHAPTGKRSSSCTGWMVS